jgi:hypothetical protein
MAKPQRLRSITAMVLIGSLLATGCASAPGNPAVSSSTPSPADRPTESPAIADNAGHTALLCPVTKPEPAFTAPLPSPAKPPENYQSDWFGTADLYTMLRFGGEVWRGLPHNPDGLTQKTFWWSSNWPFRSELEPNVSVVGVRLDGPGRFEAGHPGTNASADFGVAMLVGVDIPTTGCWRLTATYRGADLSYIVLVED